MAVTTILREARRTRRNAEEMETSDWVHLAACGALIAGGVLLLSRQRKAGLVAAAAGTALALLEHEDSLSRWWNALPAYLDRAQQMMRQMQETVEEIGEKGDSIRRSILR